MLGPQRILLPVLALLAVAGSVAAGEETAPTEIVKQAMREATNTLVGLSRMGAEIRWFDAGGGLGVDYDGSRTAFHSSMNYSIREYADAIVWALLERCNETGVRHPDILTESGRATVAHHAVLVVEATDVSPAVQPVPEAWTPSSVQARLMAVIASSDSSLRCSKSAPSASNSPFR